MNRCSCSTMVFRYFTGRNSPSSGRRPSTFKAVCALGDAAFFLDRDDARNDGMRGQEGPLKKPLGGSRITRRAEPKLQVFPAQVHCSVQIQPAPLLLDVGLLHQALT